MVAVSVSERTYTDEELEELFDQRLKQRKDLITEAVGALRPELEGMRKEISSANHVKRTLGRQLTALSRLVQQTNAELGRHVVLPAHPGTAEAIARMEDVLDKGEALTEEFGVEQLSLEQKQALPGMLRDYVNDQVERKKLDRRDSRRRAWLQVASAFAGSVAGAIAATVSILTYLAKTGGHHP